jgi:hypothetical protein
MERNLTPLELIHPNLYETNGVLMQKVERNISLLLLIMWLDFTIYIYMLKPKDETLEYLKLYKVEVEN